MAGAVEEPPADIRRPPRNERSSEGGVMPLTKLVVSCASGSRASTTDYPMRYLFRPRRTCQGVAEPSAATLTISVMSLNCVDGGGQRTSGLEVAPHGKDRSCVLDAARRSPETCQRSCRWPPRA